MLSAAAISQVGPLETQVKSLYKSELGSIRLIGICSADSGGSCWDANGRRNANLTRQFRRAWADSALPFRYNRKNRIALFEIDAKPPNKSGDRILPTWHYMPTMFEWPGMANEGRHIEPYEISCDPGKNTETVRFASERFGKPSGLLPLKPGGSIAYEGAHWTFAGAYEGEPRGSFGSSNTTIMLSVDRPSPIVGQCQWKLFDSQGRAIEVCDFRGHPVPGAHPQEPSWTAWQSYPGSAAELPVQINRDSGLIPEEVVLSTNVRLADIAGLKLVKSRIEPISFRDIPLVPKH